MRLGACFALLTALSASPAVASPILSIQPSALTVTVGSTFSLDITITGAIDLYAFEFDLGFNQTALSANSISEGLFLPSGGATFFVPGTISNVAGTISFTADTLLTAISGVTGGGTLATVSFTALAPANTTISLFNIVLLDSQLSGIAGTAVPASVTVTGQSAVVPEPSTLALIGTGLMFGGRRFWNRGR